MLNVRQDKTRFLVTHRGLIPPLAFLIRRWCVAAFPITMILAANTKARLRPSRVGDGPPSGSFCCHVGGSRCSYFVFLEPDRMDLIALAVLAMSVPAILQPLSYECARANRELEGKTLKRAVADFLAFPATLSVVGRLTLSDTRGRLLSAGSRDRDSGGGAARGLGQSRHHYVAVSSPRVHALA